MNWKEVLTFVVGFAIVLGAIVAIIMQIPAADKLLALAGLVIGYLFGVKQEVIMGALKKKR